MRRSQRTSIDANSACASSSKSRHSRCLRGPVSLQNCYFARGVRRWSMALAVCSSCP